MATAAFAVRQPARMTPLALWHLLSLDAPTVATLWTVFAAHALHARLPITLAPAMFLAVWLLYAADRLLDAHPAKLTRWLPQVLAQSHPADDPQHLQPRHRFHSTYRTRFTAAILIAAAALAILIPALPHALLRPYLILAALLAFWFALIHLTSLTLPKELAPGLFFAAAVFIPVPHAVLPAMLFAALCTLNCLYIHHWEHPPNQPVACPHPQDGPAVVHVGLSRRLTTPAQGQTAQPNPSSHPATTFALHHLSNLTLAIAILPLTRPTPISIAVSLSALALLTLDHYHHHLPPTTLRAAADLALLTPILVLPFLL